MWAQLTSRYLKPSLTAMLQSDGSYRAFTRRFDQVVSFADKPSRPAHERSWVRFQEETLELRTSWQIVGGHHADKVRGAITDEIRRETLVTLLIDQSGSMKGDRMLTAAAAVDVAREFLVHLGVSVEVLGFTTRSWKGGWSRRIWRWTGRRSQPGRLCDLLHIVYAEAGDHRPGAGLRSLAHMLDPELPKENVDGEAMLWAASRQDLQAYRRKLLVLVSDGAPVDDSTLLANGPNYLMDHLRQVVARLQDTRTLAQLQIGDEAESQFAVKRRIDTLSEVGPALLQLLSDMLLGTMPATPNC